MGTSAVLGDNVDVRPKQSYLFIFAVEAVNAEVYFFSPFPSTPFNPCVFLLLTQQQSQSLYFHKELMKRTLGKPTYALEAREYVVSPC